MRGRKPLSTITAEQVLEAYQRGYFPMARGRWGRIDWFMAEPRTVIPLDDRFRVRRSLRQAVRKTTAEIRINYNFPAIIRACSRHTEVSAEEVWLSEEMIELYTELHWRGFAHSVEVWDQGELTGGLYGVAIQGAFFGESMFSRRPSTSQIALVALVERLRERGYLLLDAQMQTPHIARFGAFNLSHNEYLGYLAEALLADRAFV